VRTYSSALALRLVGSLFLAGAVASSTAATAATSLQEHLQQLFPSATSISPKELAPPHFKVFSRGPLDRDAVTGVAFLTTDIEPLERGYDGPITMLVGMDMTGRLTGVIVLQHHEPYGNFSIEPAEFAAQFVGKNIRDPFRVGEDIDAVSRASITMASASRAIRNSARRVARALLPPPPQQP
jgi:NosR/NirI family transcriptional regulator, nitrous oxide reductase regulator